MSKVEFTVANVDFEFRQVLEDDASMRQITPMPKIHEHLKNLYGDELFSKWKSVQDEKENMLHRRHV